MTVYHCLPTSTMFRVLGIFLLFGLVYAKYEIYDGSSVYELNIKNEKEAKMISFLEEKLGLDILSHPGVSRAGQVLVPKEVKEEFEYKLKVAGIDYKMGVENIKEFMELEDKILSAAASKKSNITRSGLQLDRIYTLEEINDYVDLLGREYPETVTVVIGGTSVEGRRIRHLRISTTNFQDTTKPIVYIESLLHAREWVTQAVTLYALQQLVIDVTERDLLNDIDWIIVPVANPDGYAHTHGTSGNARYWRKNRSTGHVVGNVCMGVDLNRNFDIFYGTASSSSVCSDTFHGPGAFSEPETAAIRDILAEHGDRIELFLDIHSFGSWILYGWGNGQFPANVLTLNLIGVGMAQAIDEVKLSYNPNYVVGNVALILYQASGSAADYAMSVGVPLSYTYELPGYRFGGNSVLGFLVDPEFIPQAGFETWEGIKVAARFSRDTYRKRKGL